MTTLFYKGTLAGLTLLTLSNSVFAETIIIQPNTIINQPKTYENTTLDLKNGSFLIKNKAKLTIKNSTVIGTLSPTNPSLINIDDGSIELEHNTFKINAENIAPHPKTQSLQHVIQVALGNVTLSDNTFSINKSFSAGFLVTTASIATDGIKITHNKFKNFHGVLYLITSDNALINDNTFTQNSYGNIVLIGNNGNIVHNSIFYSGNNKLGNSMDIIDSSNINIRNNILLTPTCHGIYVLNSHDLLVDNNRITGGITYAMNIYTYPEKVKQAKNNKIDKMEKYVFDIASAHKMKNLISNNITITNNYMSQNRFGVAASDVDGLTVKNNLFIQRFVNADARKFWTNNNILLSHVTHLTWSNNTYKEAFSQESTGGNLKSFNLVPFPKSGGITL